MNLKIKSKFLSVCSFIFSLLCLFSLASCSKDSNKNTYDGLPENEYVYNEIKTSDDLANIPDFSDTPFVVINDNDPYFTKEDIRNESIEFYSSLDSLGRCGVAFACIGVDIMPDEPRGSIGQVKPSGWQTVKYDIVDGKYLYNRCHLIGFQLSGENANEKNLITGTRFMNVEGMLPFENMVADYVRETENHVMYMVTPVFDGADLVAKGVLMEALSVEDNGDGICFCVFVYNVQPGIKINYRDGSSCLEETNDIFQKETEQTESDQQPNYILNKGTKKFHYPNCKYASDIKNQNKELYVGTRDELISKGYSPCGSCKP